MYQDEISNMKNLIGKLEHNSLNRGIIVPIFVLADKKENKYGIFQENNSTFIIKKQNTGGEYVLIEGEKNRDKYIYTTRKDAESRLYLMVNSINESINEEKYVMKVDAPPSPVVPSQDTSFDNTEDNFDINDTEDDLNFDDTDEFADDTLDDDNEDQEDDPKKLIQKWVGKATQKIRELGDDVDASFDKGIINSVISAIRWDKMSEEDIEDVITKIEDNTDGEIDDISTDFENDDDDNLDTSDLDAEEPVDDFALENHVLLNNLLDECLNEKCNCDTVDEIFDEMYSEGEEEDDDDSELLLDIEED